MALQTINTNFPIKCTKNALNFLGSSQIIRAKKTTTIAWSKLSSRSTAWGSYIFYALHCDALKLNGTYKQGKGPKLSIYSLGQKKNEAVAFWVT